MAALEYYVIITEDKTEKVVKKMGPFALRQAERVERGASINLDHINYSIEII